MPAVVNQPSDFTNNSLPTDNHADVATSPQHASPTPTNTAPSPTTTSPNTSRTPPPTQSSSPLPHFVISPQQTNAPANAKQQTGQTPSPPNTTQPSPSASSSTLPRSPDTTKYPFRISVTVPRDAVGFIIGKRGETVRNMMQRSSAYIHVDREDTNPNAPVRLFHIQGEQAAVTTARALITEKVHAVLHGKPHVPVQDVVTQSPDNPPDASQTSLLLDTDFESDPSTPRPRPLEMWIPRGCVGMIIGQGGQVINEMQEKAGATIVVHNNTIDPSGSKLLTISGGQHEKQVAKTLINSLLNRVASRSRTAPTGPPQSSDQQFNAAHPQQHQNAPQQTPQHTPVTPSHPHVIHQPHPHPQGPPWPYAAPHALFNPPVADFLNMQPPMGPWMPPIPIPQPPNLQTQMPQHPVHQPQPAGPQPHHPLLAPQNPLPFNQHSLPPFHMSDQTQPPSQPQTPTPTATPTQTPSQTPMQLQQPQPPPPTPTHGLLQHGHPLPFSQQGQPPLQPHLLPSSMQQPPMAHSPQQTHIPQPQMFPHIHQQLLQSAQAAQRQHQQPMQTGVYRGSHLHQPINNMMEPPMTPPGQHQRPLSWNMPQMPYGIPPQMPVQFDGNPALAANPLYKQSIKTVNVPTKYVGIVIGRSGETIRDLQQRSGATIRVTPDREAAPGDKERLIYISGQPVQVELAHSLVNDVINEGINHSYRDGVDPPSEPLETEGATEAQATQSGLPVDDGTILTGNERAEGDNQEPGGNSNGDTEGHHGNGKEPVGDRTEINDDDNDKTGVDGDASREAGGSNWTDADETDDWSSAPVKWGAPPGSSSSSRPMRPMQAEEEADEDGTEFVAEGRFVQRQATKYPSESISYELRIPDAKVGMIIGKRGTTIRQLQQKSGARIAVSKKMDMSHKDNPRAVTITGPKPFVEIARRLIMGRIYPPGDVADVGGNDGDDGDFDDRVGASGVDELAVEFGQQRLTGDVPGGMAAMGMTQPAGLAMAGFPNEMGMMAGPAAGGMVFIGGRYRNVMEAPYDESAPLQNEGYEQSGSAGVDTSGEYDERDGAGFDDNSNTTPCENAVDGAAGMKACDEAEKEGNEGDPDAEGCGQQS